MTIKEEIDDANVTGPGNSMTQMSSGEENTTEKSPVGGDPEDQRNKPVTAAKTPQKAMLIGHKTGIQKLSNDVEKGAKIANSSAKELKSPVSRDEASKHIPHYLRPSTSSCHDACKYGAKAHSHSLDVSKNTHTHARVSNKTSLAPSKSAVPKIYKSPKSIQSNNSLDGSASSSVSNSSKVSPKQKTIGNTVPSQVKMVKSTPEKSKDVPAKSSSDRKPKLSITPPTISSSDRKPKLSITPPTISSSDRKPKLSITPPTISSSDRKPKLSITPPTISSSDRKPKLSITPPTIFSSDRKPKLSITPPTMLYRSAKPAGNAKIMTPPSKLARNGHGNAKTIIPSPKPAGIAKGTAKIANPQPNKKMALKTGEHLLKKTETKTAKSDLPRSVRSTTSPVPQEENPNEVGTLDVCGSGTEESGTDNQILANVGEDAHQFYEHSLSAGDSSDKEHEHALMKHNDYEDDHSVKEHSNDGIMIPIARESADGDEYVADWSGDLEPYGENFAMDYDDQEFDEQDSEYSEYSEYSESGSHDEQGESARVRKEHQMMVGEEGDQGAEKLRFRRGQELPGREEDRAFVRRRFRSGRNIDQSVSNPQPENVVLRHQDVQGRKASEEFMLNHVIEETVNKLAHTRKSKVKALVGAFESVISLKESETNELKHAATKDLSQLSTLQECT